MKIRHRIPVERLRLTESVTPAYQAAVDATMARAANRELRAFRALESAKRRLGRVQRVKQPTRKQVHAILVARELVELRRQELLAVQRLTQASPASAEHRGRESYRPVIPMRTL